MQKIPLTPRMKEICAMVDNGAKVADIGTDHAYIPIFLICQKIITYAVASDLRPGPLEQAKQHLMRYGASSCVRLCLANGLEGIEPNEVDTAILAGMGGELITKLISASIPVGIQCLLLQPMTHPELIRENIAKVGFTISQEKLVKEGRKLYVVMKAKRGEGAPCGRRQQYFSSLLYDDPLFETFIIKEQKRAKAALAGMEKSDKWSEEADRMKWIVETTEELLCQR